VSPPLQNENEAGPGKWRNVASQITSSVSSTCLRFQLTVARRAPQPQLRLCFHPRRCLSMPLTLGALARRNLRRKVVCCRWRVVWLCLTVDAFSLKSVDMFQGQNQKLTVQCGPETGPKTHMRGTSELKPAAERHTPDSPVKYSRPGFGRGLSRRSGRRQTSNAGEISGARRAAAAVSDRHIRHSCSHVVGADVYLRMATFPSRSWSTGDWHQLNE